MKKDDNIPDYPGFFRHNLMLMGIYDLEYRENKWDFIEARNDLLFKSIRACQKQLTGKALARWGDEQGDLHQQLCADFYTMN